MTSHGLLEDLKWALRSLARTPGFSLLAAFILALGIGANTAIFSLVDQALLRPLPYPAPGRLVALWEQTPLRGGLREYFSAADFQDWQSEATQFKAMAALTPAAMNLTGALEPERLKVGRVSGTFFTVLGVRPVLGRGFLPEEDVPGAPRVTVATHEFWQRRLGGDPGAVGRSLRLDGADVLLVGVLPPGFDCAHRIAKSDLFTPLALTDAERNNRNRHWLTAVGRLREGATVQGAELELKGICARLERENPGTNAGYSARVAPLRDELVRDAKGTLWALLGAVGFVLLIACANVANLLLARGARRQRELAIRSALGADRGRLFRLLLAESALLGLLGGAGGWLAAGVIGQGLAAQLGIQPGQGRAAVLVFTLGVSLAAALLAGLTPAWQFSAADRGEALKEGAKGSASPAHNRLRGLLVAAEVALATALLIGAGLLLRTLHHLQNVAPGFQARGAFTIQVTLPARKYPGNGAQGDFARRILPRLEAIPGVQAASAMDVLPLSGYLRGAGYDVEGLPPTKEGFESICHRASPGYFRAMGIPLLRGRDFEPQDTQAVIVNEVLARRHWGQGDPLGQRLRVGGDDHPALTIVGVVGDVRHDGLAQEPRAECYVPLLDPGSPDITAPYVVLVLRSQVPPQGLLPALKRALGDVDPELPLGAVRTMEEMLDQNRKDARARGILFGGFAALALVLAGVGIFGVVSFLTGLRTREIGIRMALGAQLRDVLGLVVGQGLRMVAAGLGAGLLLAFCLGRLLQAQLHGVGPLDPLTYGLVAVLLALVGALACLLPAVRAGRVDPVVALRNE